VSAGVFALLKTVIVYGVITAPRLLGVVCVLALGIPSGLAACSSADRREATTAASGSRRCPATPANVVVSVDQWGDIVSALGGTCANVKTVVASSSVDPHEYEPSPADAAAFSGAQLVVVNGAGYDPWASKLVDSSAPHAQVVNAAEITKTPPGANPHLWYSPSAVNAVADAVTAQLTKSVPRAASVFAAQRSVFAESLRPYTNTIGRIKSAAGGRSYAATETVFDYMGEAVGLADRTPRGYQRASVNATEPSPADLGEFSGALAARQIDVLIYNTQTEGPVPAQLRSSAERSGVPVVEVTETVAPGAASFLGWQVGQLMALAKALNVPN
jgi:zinc/manganese transport system substrate-binding protein